MSPVKHPLRVRVYGGRAVHAAREFSGADDHITACDYYLAAGAPNHWLTDDTTVTCRRCTRKEPRP